MKWLPLIHSQEISVLERRRQQREIVSVFKEQL
jgi:hypothetical protein